MKIAAAKSRLEDRLAGLTATVRALVLAALTKRTFSPPEEEPCGCPACGETGYVWCEIEDTGEYHFHWDQVGPDDYVDNGVTRDQVVYAVVFTCSACGLELDAEELTALGIDTEYERPAREASRWKFDRD